MEDGRHIWLQQYGQGHFPKHCCEDGPSGEGENNYDTTLREFVTWAYQLLHKHHTGLYGIPLSDFLFIRIAPVKSS